MTKRFALLSIAGALMAAVSAGPARAAKLYAVSAEAEPSNGVLYRYDIAGPNDHRCETGDAANPPAPELVLPIGAGWPTTSPGALAFSPWNEMFVFDRGYGGNGAGVMHRFLDPAGPSPVLNGTIDAASLGLSSPFRTFHWGAFRGDEIFVAERYGVVSRFLFDGSHTAAYNGSFLVTPSPGWDSPRAAKVSPWGEVFVGFWQTWNTPPIARYLIDASGSAVPNGGIDGCGIRDTHDMTFTAVGDMFVTTGSAGRIVRVTFDASGASSCSVAAEDPRLYGTIAVALAPWGELFVSNHTANQVTRWLDAADGTGRLVYNGTIYTPIGPVTGFWGPVDGIGDVEFVPEIDVSIDVRPGVFPNSVNPTAQGQIPVAVLTTAGFDAASVDAASVRFGVAPPQAAPAKWTLTDVDLDGDLDLLLYFATPSTGIVCGSTSVALTGTTRAGVGIRGADSVVTAGCKK